MAQYQRWNIHHRLQHFLLFSSFLVLTFTGIPIKYAYYGWAVKMTALFGGFETMLAIHKGAGLVMVTAALYHLLYILYALVFRWQLSTAVFPSLQDVKDVFQHTMFCLGFSKEDAKFGRYSYKEKFDYWAVFWGMTIMVGSGLMMWFPHISARYLPRTVIDAAQVAHSDEAMLAIMAIFVWHFFNAHFSPTVFPMSLVWFHGRVSQHEMEEFHPVELAKNPPPKVGAGSMTPAEAAVTAEVEANAATRNTALILIQMVVYAAILIWFLSVFLPFGLK